MLGVLHGFPSIGDHFHLLVTGRAFLFTCTQILLFITTYPIPLTQRSNQIKSFRWESFRLIYLTFDWGGEITVILWEIVFSGFLVILVFLGVGRLMAV